MRAKLHFEVLFMLLLLQHCQGLLDNHHLIIQLPFSLANSWQQSRSHKASAISRPAALTHRRLIPTGAQPTLWRPSSHPRNRASRECPSSPFPQDLPRPHPRPLVRSNATMLHLTLLLLVLAQIHDQPFNSQHSNRNDRSHCS